MPQINTQISPCANGPACVLKFLFMDVNRNVGTDKMLQTTGVVEMKVAHNNSFYILDVVAGLLDSRWELLVLRVGSAWEDIRNRGAPILSSQPLIDSSEKRRGDECETYDFEVLGTSGLEQNEAKSRIFD